MYNDTKHNKLITKLLENGTIYVPQSDFDIIKIDEHDTYYQIWYKYPMKIHGFSDKTRPEVSWLKVPFKNINQHLRKEKLKQLTNNINENR